jgi:3-oxoacyl-[acyl-carrier-protein] synthase III
MVLGPSSDPERGILSTHLHIDGSQADILCIKTGGSKTPLTQDLVRQRLNKVAMNGREVYKFAVRALTDSTNEALTHNRMSADSVTHVCAHQANIRILEAVLDRVGIPLSKAWVNIDRYGNTSSASLPITLDEANRAGRLKEGDTVAMMAIGAGMAWGSGLLRW